MLARNQRKQQHAPVRRWPNGSFEAGKQSNFPKNFAEKKKRKIINRRIKKGEREKRERGGGKKEKQAGKLDKRAFPRN